MERDDEDLRTPARVALDDQAKEELEALLPGVPVEDLDDDIDHAYVVAKKVLS